MESAVSIKNYMVLSLACIFSSPLGVGTRIETILLAAIADGGDGYA